VPENDLIAIDDLVREGLFPNINEAISSAIRDLLKKQGMWPLKQISEGRFLIKMTSFFKLKN
jgi:Arc/MetJ-type ribon-helix-helix transcriptional regulator